MKMQGIILSVSLASTLLLTACSTASTSQSFSRFSAEEMFAYNRDKPLAEQVTCITQARTGTYIRKTLCKTNLEWAYELHDAYMSLNTLVPSTGYSVISGRD